MPMPTSRKWVKEEYIDYICPQIYWYIGHKAADYDNPGPLVGRCGGRHRCASVCGHGRLSGGQQRSLFSWYGVKALEDMLALNKTIPQVSGEVHFRYQLMVQNPEIVALYQKGIRSARMCRKNRKNRTLRRSRKRTVKPVLNQTDHGAYIQGAEGLFRPGDSLRRAISESQPGRGGGHAGPADGGRKGSGPLSGR